MDAPSDPSSAPARCGATACDCAPGPLPRRAGCSLSLSSTVAELPLIDCMLLADARVSQAASLFAAIGSLPGVMVRRGQRIGLLARREFYEAVATDGGLTAWAASSLRDLLDRLTSPSLEVAENVDINEAAQQALTRPDQSVYDPLIVRFQDGLRRLLDAQVLLQAQTDLMALANDELRRQEEELRVATAEAERMNQLKSAFLANVSHEIRTPLNGVIGFAESILACRDTEAAKKQASTILNESEHLLGLINTLLDHAKIEAGKLELEYVPVSVESLMEGVVSATNGQARAKGLRLDVSVGRNVPACILADPLRMRQVLLNLVHNAIKFTEQGFVRVEIAATDVQNEWATLRFAVVDTGIGIEPDKQKVIFETFTQADGTISRRFGGTGLGTTISRQLVELMGGKMGLESQPGQGSRFWFDVNVDVADFDDAPEPEEEIADLRKELQAIQHAEVLVAEDYPTNQEVVRLHLGEAGHAVTIVDNGAEALQACREKIFDLVLMDVQMPVMDGLEAARRIRSELEAYAFIPIVALTANGEMDMRLNCMQAGMNDILVKPIRRKPLLQAAAAWLSPSLDEQDPPAQPATITGDADLARAETLPEQTALDPAMSAALAPPIDWDQAVQEFGGDASLVASVIEGFFAQVDEQMPRIQRALDIEDAATLAAEAHKIRGAAANLVAVPLSEAARRLEQAATAGDLSGASGLVDNLTRSYQDLREFLAAQHVPA